MQTNVYQTAESKIYEANIDRIGELDSYIIIVKEFNSLLSVVDRKSRLEIKRNRGLK